MNVLTSFAGNWQPRCTLYGGGDWLSSFEYAGSVLHLMNPEAADCHRDCSILAHQSHKER